MEFNNYIDAIERKRIEDAIKNHECYDSWGLAEYGNNDVAVDYNLCIDNSTEETENCSAFYKIVNEGNGVWYHDNCSKWYHYEIDFNDEYWEQKLEEAAKLAFDYLFSDETVEADIKKEIEEERWYSIDVNTRLHVKAKTYDEACREVDRLLDCIGADYYRETYDRTEY